MGERTSGTAKAVEEFKEENQEKEKRTKMHTQDGRARRGVERTSVIDDLEYLDSFSDDLKNSIKKKLKAKKKKKI